MDIILLYKCAMFILLVFFCIKSGTCKGFRFITHKKIQWFELGSKVTIVHQFESKIKILQNTEYRIQKFIDLNNLTKGYRIKTIQGQKNIYTRQRAQGHRTYEVGITKLNFGLWYMKKRCFGMELCHLVFSLYPAEYLFQLLSF